MKILFVAPSAEPTNGIGSYVACMAPALAARGHRVHVLLCCSDGNEPSDEVRDGVAIHRRAMVPIHGARLLAAPLAAFYLRRGLSSFFEYRRLGISFDVIEYPEWLAEGLIFAVTKTVPTVAHLHAASELLFRYNGLVSSRDTRWASRLERFSVDGADMVTAPSACFVDNLRAVGWLRRQDIEVIPQAVDWQRWCVGGSAADSPPTVIFMGRLEPLKAPETLIEALSVLRQGIPEARAVFAGYFPSSETAAPDFHWWKGSTAGLEGCEFLGPVLPHQLPDLLSSCRVFTQPSWSESFGLAALEAMAAGRPVVVTSTCGIAELVSRFSAGAVVPPGDPKALAEAIRPFLRDAAYAAVVGERGSRAVREHLSPDRIAECREKIYIKAIQIWQERRNRSYRSRLYLLHKRLTRNEARQAGRKIKVVSQSDRGPKESQEASTS